jgi:histidinol-phosphate aminotransferase
MAHRIDDLIPEYISGLPVYVPGRPIEDVERELKIRAIKLASNENPLGPSPKAMEAARRALAESHRYPDGGTLRLRERLARIHSITPDEIFVGLGSSEAIDLAARLMLRAGRTGITSAGSYAPYSIAIRASGAGLLHVPMRAFAYDLPAIADAIRPDTHVIYLANPNNPTGTAFSGDDFQRFLEHVPADILVVLDEAYIHYADPGSMPRSVDLFRRRENLLILRTFSKIYGLAGLRIGYAIGRTFFVAAMNKLRTPFNAPGISQAAALAALDDVEHVRRSVSANTVERERVFAGLLKLGLRAVRSQASFIFIDVGPTAVALYEELLREGVIVRPLGWMGLPEALRVTVGTPEENDKLLTAMSRCLQAAQERNQMTQI